MQTNMSLMDQYSNVLSMGRLGSGKARAGKIVKRLRKRLRRRMRNNGGKLT